MTTSTVTPVSSPLDSPVSSPSFDAASVVALAEVVDRDGLDAHAATLTALAQRASASGVSPVLLDVMLGTGEPYVARLRAFTRVGAAVVSRRRPRTAGLAAGRLVAA